MIRISQLELNIHHTDKELEDKILKVLAIRTKELKTYYIVKQSIDARKKDDIRYSYTIDAEVNDESRVRGKGIQKIDPVIYRWPSIKKTKSVTESDRSADANNKHDTDLRPVIVGTGPAGLYCGLALARAGLQPLLIERGESAFKRKEKVENFWKTGVLDKDTNVSFGEGGAGTFSDGKLNTLVKDESGRNMEVLRTFVEFGADSDILYLQKPHIGTDRLIEIITNIRKEIERLGGEVMFNTSLEDIESENGMLKSILISGGKRIRCGTLVLATGHSARDTVAMLYDRGLSMEKKAFAVGLRIQHPQRMIDISQFGENEAEFLSPASYKLTATAANGRGVYTFCMCPGGYVVDASSEEAMKCVNGMSYHGRASETANSALIVQVGTEDFGNSEGPLAGIEFQRKLERAAYSYGRGSIPVQLLGDYLNRRESIAFGDVVPCFKGSTSWSRLDEMLPEYIYESIRDVMPQLDKRIKGFGRTDAILAGVESRTSSPVRITRDESFMTCIKGIYPCGEGAGYAGGITSAAMDGLRVAEAIVKNY